MAAGLELDWGDGNTRHLRAHRGAPLEFEQLIASQPLDLEYQLDNGEERFKALGTTDGGRVLIAVWTIRGGRIRAITAYPAGRRLAKLYWEHQK